MEASHIYACGLIDGEGHVKLKQVKNARGNLITQSYIAVAMTDFPAIEFLHATFGRGSVCQPTKSKAHHKEQLRWTVVSLDAYHVAKLILPWSIVKREPLEAIIGHYENGARPKINRPGQKGEGSGTAKLTWDKVAEMRKLKGTMSQKAIAALFGVDQTCVSQVLSGKTWKVENIAA